MKNSPKYTIFISTLVLILAAGIFIYTGKLNIFSQSNNSEIKSANKPVHMRAIHLSSWLTGSKKFREKLEPLLSESKINALVIAIKEYEGEVYIKGVPMADKLQTYVGAIPDLESYLQHLKSKKIYTIARIVVFKDDKIPRINPELAVINPENALWKDTRGTTWINPYNKTAWEYIFSIASRCAQIGFDEIQFDYIRYPSDGNIRECRYGVKHTSTSSVNNLTDFLKEAYTRLKTNFNINISIDTFGLTTSVTHDMGIGQNMIEMNKYTDFICPMVYPSHYRKGEYGIPDPDTEPYLTVFTSLNDAKKRLGADYKKLRPYYQDFSIRHRYKTEEVLAQIQAGYDNNIYDWTLWNARGAYHTEIFDMDKVINIAEYVNVSTTAVQKQVQSTDTVADTTVLKSTETLK